MSEGRSTLSSEEEKFVRWARVARMATVGSDGRAHNVPISPVLDGGSLLIATDVSSKKVRNLAADARLTLVFDEYVEMWDLLHGVVVEGIARIVRDGEEFLRDRGLLYEKYRQYEVDSPIEQATSVILVVTPERVTSWGF
jgi:nitroimidazol reductase NimA-like FMN-containing flavoprotein (pyridoxamine 5'-phosphate oxidase superfamily)